jgi:hypothetical protein
VDRSSATAALDALRINFSILFFVFLFFFSDSNKLRVLREEHRAGGWRGGGVCSDVYIIKTKGRKLLSFVVFILVGNLLTTVRVLSSV